MNYRSKSIQSAQELYQLIVDFCEEFQHYSPLDIDPQFTFAHIVLADFNLRDGDIHFCLSREQVNAWWHQQIEELDIDDHPAHNAPIWERWEYDALVNARDTTRDFLRYLLTIPEDIREGI